MADWRDILSDEEEQLNHDELMNYLDGNLSEQEKHSFEKKAANSPFVNDAVEGLQEFKNKQQLEEHVKEINIKLKQQLKSRQHRKQRPEITDNTWLIISTLIILAICVICYFIIHLYKTSHS